MAEPSTIARPYAEAAFRLADGKGALADWSAMLANLAAFSPLAAGLGTQEWLAQDLLEPLRKKDSPVIAKSSLQFSWEDLDTRLLTLIP